LAGFSFCTRPALLARVSSHHDGDRTYEQDLTTPPQVCQNCAAILRGPYCAKCGQHDVDYHRSFYHLTHDLLENLFHFEGKFFTSVALLLAKPGKLTTEFNAGRRQSQLNPLRFYIFVTVLFFVGVHALNHGHLFDFDRKKVDRISTTVAEKVQSATKAAGGLTAAQTERVGELIGEAAAKNPENLGPEAIKEIIERARREKPAVAAIAPNAAKPKSKKRGTGEPKLTIDESDRFGLGTALKKKIEAGELTFSKILDGVESRIPTLLFLGMPVFALILKLLYWRSGRYYIEHLIFSIHLHTWAFLAFMVSNGYFKLVALGPGWMTTWFAWLLGGWMAWYVFAAFRTVYGQRWLKTTLKLGLVGTSYFFALVTLTALILVATVVWLVFQ
jgi:hypothetical protein